MTFALTKIMTIPRTFKPIISVAWLVLGTAYLPAFADDAAKPQALTAAQSTFFEGKIRAVFANNCFKCHSVDQGKSKGGLVLDSREGWQKGGDTGPAITPGDPEESLIIKAVTGADPDLPMPPKGES